MVVSVAGGDDDDGGGGSRAYAPGGRPVRCVRGVGGVGRSQVDRSNRMGCDDGDAECQRRCGSRHTQTPTHVRIANFRSRAATDNAHTPKTWKRVNQVDRRSLDQWIERGWIEIKIQMVCCQSTFRVRLFGFRSRRFVLPRRFRVLSSRSRAYVRASTRTHPHSQTQHIYAKSQSPNPYTPKPQSACPLHAAPPHEGQPEGHDAAPSATAVRRVRRAKGLTARHAHRGGRRGLVVRLCPGPGPG